jgi:hypothetical protein
VFLQENLTGSACAAIFACGIEDGGAAMAAIEGIADCLPGECSCVAASSSTLH